MTALKALAYTGMGALISGLMVGFFFLNRIADIEQHAEFAIWADRSADAYIKQMDLVDEKVLKQLEAGVAVPDLPAGVTRIRLTVKGVETPYLAIPMTEHPTELTCTMINELTSASRVLLHATRDAAKGVVSVDPGALMMADLGMGCVLGLGDVPMIVKRTIVHEGGRS